MDHQHFWDIEEGNDPNDWEDELVSQRDPAMLSHNFISNMLILAASS